jgi:tetratricopeptide (TPR) repeat protein
MGWYRETVAGPFTRPEVEFMPGAFAYHLHSFSAASLRTPDHNWVGPLLAKGATCTMGCVDEPYLGGTPDVGSFAGRWLYFGFTFGEAAYASQPVLSWQTTVVGDPLYRPFGKNPLVQHNDLIGRKSKLLEWSTLRIVNLSRVRGMTALQIATILEETPMTKESAVLTEKLADLYSEQGKPSSAIAAYERALTLNPSTQQRVRLRLTLGEKLVAAKRDEEARVNYQRLLQESPGYPGAADIEQKLAGLAVTPGK